MINLMISLIDIRSTKTFFTFPWHLVLQHKIADLAQNRCSLVDCCLSPGLERLWRLEMIMSIVITLSSYQCHIDISIIIPLLMLIRAPCQSSSSHHIITSQLHHHHKHIANRQISLLSPTVGHRADESSRVWVDNIKSRPGWCRMNMIRVPDSIMIK